MSLFYDFLSLLKLVIPFLYTELQVCFKLFPR